MKFIDSDNDVSIRGIKIDDSNNYYLSVFDFINKATSRPEGHQYGRQKFSKLIDDKSKYREEIVALTKYIKFPGELIIVLVSKSSSSILGRLLLGSEKPVEYFPFDCPLVAKRQSNIFRSTAPW